MACTQASLSGNAKDILIRERHSIRRSHSGKDLLRDRAGMRRSQSEPHFRCSLNPAKVSSTEPKLKNSHSVGIFPFHFSGSILPNSVRSFLFEAPDYSKEMRLMHSEAEEKIEGAGKDTEKRANWVEMLMELRSRWRVRQKEDDDNNNNNNNKRNKGEGEEDLCGVSYDEEEVGEVNFDRESFSNLLVKVPWADTKLFSQLAFLCNMAYVIPEMKDEDLQRCYGLHFVTSSLEKKAEVAAIKAQLERDSIISVGVTSSIQPLSAEAPTFEKKRPVRPSAAYEIAASAASYVHSRAKGLLSLGSPGPHNPPEEREHWANGGPREDESASPSRVYKSEVAAYVAASTMTAVVAAEEGARTEAARDLRSLHSSPCEWFICDDPNTYTRCFVIQGSDSAASWQANLFFEPTKFEGTEVQVHRGIYEAAKGIYEQFLPEILHHLKLYGKEAKLRFTGHSLGGSLSLLVNLMLLARGVVKPSTLLPVVTFGSPSIFCGGDHILKDLGLDDGHVYSVMMHRDIVPRAFSCDYPNHVAQLLKRLNGAFRSHPCLNSKKLLYAPLGQLFILQPDEKASPPHPLLPPGSALYALDKIVDGRALRAFLNNPHPLETLSDLTAYGSEGTILRDHDSSNYLKAINGVLREHTKWVFPTSRRERLQHWWPILTSSPHTWAREGNRERPILVSKEVATGV